MKLQDKIKEILKGIDKDETEDDDGWWETATGADFGSLKLQQLLDLFEDKCNPCFGIRGGIANGADK